MGLDCSHGAWNGGYVSFGLFRSEVARVAGIPLELMEGHYESPPEEALEWIAPRAGGPRCAHPNGPWLYHWLERRCVGLPIAWSSLRPDALHVLLNHSDCGGEIASVDCGPLADRLLSLIPELEKADAARVVEWDELRKTDNRGPAWQWAPITKQFAEGCLEASRLGEDLLFR